MEVMFHSLDSENNKVFYKSKYEKIENTYVFLDKTDAGTKVYLTVKEKEVLFERKGNTNMQLLLSLDNTTLGKYSNALGLDFEFIVKTKSLKIEEKRIEMEYSLYLDSDMLSTHKIWVLFH